MVVKTPWQFGERTFNEPNSGSVFPKLKVEHPLSRLSHPDKLSLRGVSRIGSLKSEQTTRYDIYFNLRNLYFQISCQQLWNPIFYASIVP